MLEWLARFDLDALCLNRAAVVDDDAENDEDAANDEDGLLNEGLVETEDRLNSDSSEALRVGQLAKHGPHRPARSGLLGARRDAQRRDDDVASRP